MNAETRGRLARAFAPVVLISALATSGAAASGTKDTTPPTVSLTAPGAGPVAGTVTLAATAADNNGVATVRFYVDGARLGSADMTAPYKRTWNASSAVTGRHVLTAVARDAAGNQTTSAPVTVSVGDVTPPTVTLTSPTNGATVSGTVTFAATAKDDVGVTGISYTVDGAPVGATWNTTTGAGGAHTVVVTARDAAGNTGSASASVTVANSVAPPPQSAQRFLAPAGSDSGTCATASTPCATFDYAYHQAKPGDLVQVASGTYTHAIAPGDVVLSYDATKVGAAPVTFRASGTVTVDLGSTTTVNHSPDIHGAQNVVFDGVDFLHGSLGIIPQNGSSCGVNANGVTLENLSLNGAISIRNAQNVLVENVSIGGFTYPDPGVQDAWGDSTRVGDYDCGARASHVTFDRVRWHDIYRGSSPSHAECLFVERSDYVSVTNSRLEACPIMGIFLKNDGGVSDGSNYQDHVLIENDFISRPCPTGPLANADECGSAGIFESDCDNNAYVAPPASPLQWTIAFNSLGPGAEVHFCEPASYWSTSSRLVGNIADSLAAGGPCTGAAPAELAGWTFAYDVWTGSGAVRCSSTDTTASASSLFVDPASYDLHLLSSVAPSVPAALCPAKDIDGDGRPAAGATACDAGADERR